MGYALAEASRRRGARVILVSGPTHLEPPAGVIVERVRTAEIARDEMASPSLYSRLVMQYVRMDQRSHHGGVGNPEPASAERGCDYFERIVRSLVALTEDLRDGILAG